MPFWLVATGMVGGVVGGYLAEQNDMKLYFAGGGLLLVGVGVTWGHYGRKASFQLMPNTRLVQRLPSFMPAAAEN